MYASLCADSGCIQQTLCLRAGTPRARSSGTPSYFLRDASGATPLPTPTDFPEAGTAAASRVQVAVHKDGDSCSLALPALIPPSIVLVCVCNW